VVTPAALGTLLLARGMAGAGGGQIAAAQFLQLPSVWLRLSRIGPAVTAFASTDGVGWLQMGRVDASMLPPLTLLGLAATARNNTRTTRAVIDNVTLKSYPPYPAPPDAGLSERPDSGAPDGAP
jgi:hypothetical protein